MQSCLKLFVLALLFLSISPAAFGDCNPIGQFVQLSELNLNSISFLEVLGEPKVTIASINTPACTKEKLILNEKKIMQLQEYTAAAMPSFVIMKEPTGKPGTKCLVDFRHAEEILKFTWSRSEDQCAKARSLINFRSSLGYSIYVNPKQAQLLASRNPSSVKKTAVKRK